MAKNTTLSDAIQKMIDDAERAGATAALLIRDQIKIDLEKAAHGAVDKYYEYQRGDYTRSGRQYSLYGAYRVSTDIKRNGNSFMITGSIDMSSDFLDGLHKSNSKKHQGSGSWESGGQVESDYILGNFLGGKHPWTNAWPLNGTKVLEYDEIYRKPSPNKILTDYINMYQPTLDRHFASAAEFLLRAYS